MRVSQAAHAVLSLVTLFAVTNCGDPAEKAAEAANGCGKRSCPSGTRPEETRELDASSDISGGYDPATYKAEGAYKRSGSGSCEYACVVTQACPEGTFPIINEECFTCGAISDDGEVDQGVCSDEAVVATECGKQECPVGTYFIEKRKTEGSQGYDVSQGYDPDTYDPDLVPYLTFDSGECEYQCTPFQQCPEGTFPVITKDCFNCARIDPVEGLQSQQGECTFEGSGGKGGSGGSGGSGGTGAEAGAPAVSTEGGTGGVEG